MGQKIIILGANGRLGRYMIEKYPDAICFDKDTLDITEKSSVIKVFKKERPNLVINCAAITDVEYCEKNKDECFKVNSVAVKNIVQACDKTGAKLVHFSSNYAIDPINNYGKSKKLSEEYAKEHLVLRLDMFSQDTYIIKTLLNTDLRLDAYTNNFFNPIYMGSVPDFIPDNYRLKGIINLGTKEKVSMYEFAIRVCDTFKIDKSRVHSALSEDATGKAKRPKDIYLLPDFSFSLRKEIKKLKNELKR